MRFGKATRWISLVYLGLVVLAAVAAAWRLSESLEMPGLAAIELVVLALPWSLALGFEPLARLGWIGMVAVVLGGLVLNGFLLRALSLFAERRGSARP